MAAVTVVALLEAVLFRSAAPVLAALLGWGFVLVYALVEGTVFQRTGSAVASLTLPSGATTPSVNQHSNIQAMVARGAYREAADAYQAVLAADPQDVVACEQLAQLALRDLKDYELAVRTYREAEGRADTARRRVGYALLATAILRDNVRDAGRTMRELRRVLDTYPDVPNAADLRAELAQLKALHTEAR
jgi:tetratricopeptide (TPR) repeat protein